MDNGIVIVGGGLAAGTAAETLRKEDFAGPIRVYAAEPHRPYIRPPLSKGFLTGAEGIDSAYLHDEAWAREHDVELHEGTVVAALDPAGSVTLEGGENVAFDRALLATGAASRRLHLEGAEASGIHYLRTIEDSERLRAALEPGDRRVVIVGFGWIGLEVAAAARGYGNEVTSLGLEQIPLSAALGDTIGGVFGDLHREHGVSLRGGVSVTGFETADGAVTGVRAGDEVFAGDVVVVGVGAVPNVSLAEQAGLRVERGIVTDEHMRTSAENVYAAGDVASSYHPFLQQHVRNEHWANAIDGGTVAGRALIGKDAVFDAVPYFYTDQYDLGMEYAGFPSLAADASLVFRGDVESREFIAFWVADGRVVAGMNVNVWDVNDDIKALITSRKTVDAARLSDGDVPLGDI